MQTLVDIGPLLWPDLLNIMACCLPCLCGFLPLVAFIWLLIKYFRKPKQPAAVVAAPLNPKYTYQKLLTDIDQIHKGLTETNISVSFQQISVSLRTYLEAAKGDHDLAKTRTELTNYRNQVINRMMEECYRAEFSNNRPGVEEAKGIISTIKTELANGIKI